MGQTIQSTLGFVLSFFIIMCLIISGPVLYARAQATANSYYLYKNECVAQSAIYDIRHIQTEDFDYEAVFTSPEKMHFLMRSISDVVVIVVEGVKGL